MLSSVRVVLVEFEYYVSVLMYAGVVVKEPEEQEITATPYMIRGQVAG
jgi:hypothetical protein